jgi:4-amino-4-deoxychorismate lyase
MYVYLNGNVIKEEMAKISVFEHGFMYGLGVFETFRVYDGHPFLFDDHIQRLYKSVKLLGVELNKSKEELLEAVRQVLAANELKNAYVRLNVSAGVGTLGLQTESYMSPNIIIYTKPLVENDGEQSKSVKLLRTKRNTPEGHIRIKSHHYLNNIIGKKEIGNDPQCEGVFLTKEGFVAEGVVSNIFWVKDNVVYTPAISLGILDGITRRFTLQLLKREKLQIKVGKFKKNDLLQCDEAFLTNSIQQIVPINQIEDRKLKTTQLLSLKLNESYKLYTRSLWTMF